MRVQQKKTLLFRQFYGLGFCIHGFDRVRRSGICAGYSRRRIDRKIIQSYQAAKGCSKHSAWIDAITRSLFMIICKIQTILSSIYTMKVFIESLAVLYAYFNVSDFILLYDDFNRKEVPNRDSAWNIYRGRGRIGKPKLAGLSPASVTRVLLTIGKWFSHSRHKLPVTFDGWVKPIRPFLIWYRSQLTKWILYPRAFRIRSSASATTWRGDAKLRRT